MLNILKVVGVIIVGSMLVSSVAQLVLYVWFRKNNPELLNALIAFNKMTEEERAAILRVNDEQLAALFASLTEEERSQIEQLNKELAAQ